jgi:hypothetical protein
MDGRKKILAIRSVGISFQETSHNLEREDKRKTSVAFKQT